jgi:peptidoglycan-associated lipoprotein
MTKAVTTCCALILTLALAACARQPATTGASAPSPSGAAGTTSGDAARMGAGTSADAGRGPGGALAGAGARPSPAEFRPVSDLADIHFEYDRADIRESDAKVLDANAVWLKTHADHLLIIEGHCDERGTNEYNTSLGDRRARAAMHYLVSRGVASSRISVISYGEQRPSCTQRSTDCWARNRRAHFLVKSR